MKKQFSLGNNERLKSRKQIEQLFSEGKKFTITPFRVHYLCGDDKTCSLRFGAGVSNKNFKRAVDRNRIKRLAKESYRLQKLSIQKRLQELAMSMNIFFIYTGKDVPDYKTVFEATGKILDKLFGIIGSEK